MRACERLIKYAKVYTTSDPDSNTVPSAAREFDLAGMLVEEMKALGITDVLVDDHCYVTGSIPASKGCEDKPAIGFIAHMDTAPDFCGENVKPQIIENYDGVSAAGSMALICMPTRAALTMVFLASPG